MVANPLPESASLTVEEYLVLEEASQERHEYIDGQLRAMAGGTTAHDRIANTIRTTIDAHLGDGPCAVYGPDVRLQIGTSIYYYPDAMVTCDEVEALGGQEVSVSVPRLIVEVLSEGTEAIDRGDKFADYQNLPSCEEYLLVSARRRAVEYFRRAAAGLWTYQRYGPDEVLTLESIGLTCPVAALYRRTRL